MPVLRTPEEKFAGLPEFDFEAHYVEIDDAGLGPLRVHYLDEGDPQGRVVLILHGEPAWSYMFRRSVRVLAEAGLRVIVPDLVGFGKSDKPSELSDYTYESHVRWLTDVVTQLGLHDVVLVGHDWGGLLGLRLVTELDGLAVGYVASNHGYPTGDMPPNEALRRWQEEAANSPDLAVGRVVAGACTTDLDDAVVAAYDAPYPDQSYKAGAQSFPALIPSAPDDPSADWVRKSREILAGWTKPFLTVYGAQDPIGGAADAMFQQLVPGTRGQNHVRLDDAGHNAPEDAGADFGVIVRDFATRVFAGN